MIIYLQIQNIFSEIKNIHMSRIRFDIKSDKIFEKLKITEIQ